MAKVKEVYVEVLKDFLRNGDWGKTVLKRGEVYTARPITRYDYYTGTRKITHYDVKYTKTQKLCIEAKFARETIKQFDESLIESLMI